MVMREKRLSSDDLSVRHVRVSLRSFTVGMLTLLLVVWSIYMVSVMDTFRTVRMDLRHNWVTRLSPGTSLVRGGKADDATAALRHAMDMDVNISVAETLKVTPSKEQWPMQEEFYDSYFDSSNDTSTTIIFNVFRGEPKALEIQLEAASCQKNLKTKPDVWVMCFNSPKQKDFEKVVDKFKAKIPNLVFTASNFNHKFHGRFLLAYMAKTKYVLIVDDDKMIDSTTVADYIKCMKKQPGVWGNFGHLRAPAFDGYKSWPRVGYNIESDDFAEQDYLSGMWFLEQSWLEYFVKERPPSWETSEDMHLSHVMRKYLNLNTYGGKVALDPKHLPGKDHAATVGSALHLREYIFDHQHGRGNKVANIDTPLQTLVYAETVQDIEDFLDKMRNCPDHMDKDNDLNNNNGNAAVRIGYTDPENLPPWCNVGKTAVVFRGAREQDVQRMVEAAEVLCRYTNCEYFSLKPKIKHAINYFNMREGFGQHDTDIPWQTAASDVLLSLVGVLNNVLPQNFYFPYVSHIQWHEPEAAAKKQRLQVYHSTVKLALQIHANSKTNAKWDHRADASADAQRAYPTNMKVYVWWKTPATYVEPRAMYEQLSLE
uniref:Uncharacterized protein n=1 Tax=Globisporangium ultimum (strain ATCC 200006 / CBS 805.95 / DAOM BR144) TaxID=431595 RepID=K3WTR3_GLOUD